MKKFSLNFFVLVSVGFLSTWADARYMERELTPDTREVKLQASGQQFIGLSLDWSGEDWKRKVPLFVQSVEVGSEAEAAGIQKDDRVLAINGVPADFLNDNKIQSMLDATLVKLVLMEPVERRFHFKLKKNSKKDLYGLSCIGKKGGSYLFHERVSDFVITDVEPNSIAFRAGLREGDRIESVNEGWFSDLFGETGRYYNDVALEKALKSQSFQLEVVRYSGVRWMTLDQPRDYQVIALDNRWFLVPRDGSVDGYFDVILTVEGLASPQSLRDVESALLRSDPTRVLVRRLNYGQLGSQAKQRFRNELVQVLTELDF